MLGLGGGKTRGTGPIGLALSGSEVRLAQRLAGGGFALACEPLSKEADLTGPAYHAEVSRAVATALRRAGFAGKAVVSALPVDAILYKTLRLPPMPDDELAQAVAWEAADRYQIKDDQSIQFVRAGGVKQGNEQREEVILLAANKSDIHDHALSVKRAGLMPAAIDATGAALARLFGEAGKSAMVVHMTERVAEIVGVRDGAVIFDKLVQLTVMQGRVDVPGVARELGLCLRYLSVTFGVHKPDALYLCGERATSELSAQLSEAVGMPLRSAEQALSRRQVLCAPEEAAHWAVAVGLAERNEKGSARRGAA